MTICQHRPIFGNGVSCKFQPQYGNGIGGVFKYANDLIVFSFIFFFELDGSEGYLDKGQKSSFPPP